MKIERSVAVAFLVALGYPKAGEWDEVKLKDRLRQTPDRIDAKKVSAEHQGIYEELKQLPAETPIEFVDVQKSVPAKPKNPAAGKKPKAKPESASSDAGKKPKADPKKPKDGEEAKEEKTKPAKAQRQTLTDEYGSRPGTVRAKVNSALSVDWKSDEEIAVDAGVSLKQARIRLRRAKKTGLVQARRLFQYKWVRQN